MQIILKIEAVITLPEGTTVPEEGRAFTLPNGDWVKPFIVMELNDEVDLDGGAMLDMGIDVLETDISWEEDEHETV
jgi:hypothetical protein